MRIIGIDPGYAILGYGIVDMKSGRFSLVEYGVITTEAHTTMAERLKIIYGDLMEKIGEHEPETAAIEELFFNSNAKTALKVGEARGAAILACVNSGLPVFEYTPLQIKQALVGYGRAEKEQIQQVVRSILGLREIPRPDDAADGVAAAICHGNSSGYLERVGKAVRDGMK